MVDQNFFDIIQEIIDSANYGDYFAKECAKDLDALFVGCDINNYWFINKKGIVVVTDGEEIQEFDNQLKRFSALMMGSEKYPVLLSLLPKRPNAALSCPACQGTGLFMSKIYCNNCGGIGWLLD
jgi:hypothetical protein